MVEHISKEDLVTINSEKQKLEGALLKAESAAKDAQLAKASYQIAVQHIYIKYGLSFDHQINDNDGTVSVRPSAETLSNEEPLPMVPVSVNETAVEVVSN